MDQDAKRMSETDLEVITADLVPGDAGPASAGADAPGRGSLAVFGACGQRNIGLQARVSATPDLSREWALAFERWLEDSASSERTQQAYRRAWDDCLVFCAALPETGDDTQPQPVVETWQITHKHIRAWVKDMETRPLDPRRRAALRRYGMERAAGYAASTINQYLAAVSSFYAYAEHNWPVLLPNGMEVPLTLFSGMTMNPVRVIKRKVAGAPRREQPFLSVDQLRRFLYAIPRDTLIGLRDRALFTLYIMTGARNTEVRTLTWGDFQERGGRMFWSWHGKGSPGSESEQGWKELSPEVWGLIGQYLKAVGRWGTMAEGDFVFTAISGTAVNLPTVSSETWNPYVQPLSAREVNRRVKMYAARAGLDGREVHVHTLRHSAAMLMDEAGADLEEIRRFLNHESLSTTQGYMHKMKGERNVHAGRMAELLRL
jgi:integrase